MKKVVILGSTGSIGKNALQVIRQFPEKFKVLGLAVKSSINLLKEQIEEFKPEYVAVYDKKACEKLKKEIQSLNILCGTEGVCEIAGLKEADIVLSAIVGAEGLLPTFEAVKAGKVVALANKESLVMAGDLIKKQANHSGAQIIPVDSEHSAVFQCINGCNKPYIRKIWLTASGGPFRGKKTSEIENVTPQEALNHPKWKMGKRITIDSATLMNKGFEVIEAHFLFDIPVENIAVLIHPQSIVHCLVEFIDGTYLAQISNPDMKAPIALALSLPERLPDIISPIDWKALRELNFELPDTEVFPCLSLAYEAVRIGGSMPVVLNAADEIAVDAFLSGKLKFNEIPKLIKKVMDAHRVFNPDSIEEILEVDSWARKKALKEIKK
ncbi:MAG: 1-deoxy-D-xylulose-5-phosphate reductoisomerase [Thermodesulfovibrio sp.]|uniref:1-deoxy-D-xylulose 5-phosphate reductoisomerase n=2 Tax=Thermodesulfovibrio TaxID=28261 RepID=A0A2J6WGH2_9BACT|nr:MAG: 1-deoxy-D-xylulose-5-phosphate reductoisomerase [Thermodesulfovibrio aggregans]